jgi:hypothetical protein
MGLSLNTDEGDQGAPNPLEQSVYSHMYFLLHIPY